MYVKQCIFLKFVIIFFKIFDLVLEIVFADRKRGKFSKLIPVLPNISVGKIQNAVHIM